MTDQQKIDLLKNLLLDILLYLPDDKIKMVIKTLDEI
jgi:hypothetical protein